MSDYFIFIPSHESSLPEENTPISSRAIPFVPGQTVASALFLSGAVPPAALCNGLGHCGRCKIRIFPPFCPHPCPQDTLLLPQADIEQGWRLGCRHQASSDMVVTRQPAAELPTWDTNASEASAQASQGTLPITFTQQEEPGQIPNNSDQGPFFLGVDFGTTSLQAALDSTQSLQTMLSPALASPPSANWETPAPLRTLHTLSPHMGAGSEVISRLAFAQTLHGKEQLHVIWKHAVHELLKASKQPIVEICLAANPAVTVTALGKSIDSLATAPYALPYEGGCYEQIEGLPPLWVAPLLSPFVGGDTAAAYCAILAQPEKPIYPFLLADLGTNGEFLLALSPSESIICSVALGPALEGIGLWFGTIAEPGAITRFTLSPKGIDAHIWDGAHASTTPYPPLPITGVSGTGYLSLLSLLKKNKALNEDGTFPHTIPGILRTRLTDIAPLCRCAACQKTNMPKVPILPGLGLPHNFLLTGQDIEEILKVKAAFSLGLTLLLRESGLQSYQLARVYLAGALGKHVAPDDLETLGFFPAGFAKRIVCTGNAALLGARLLAQSKRAREQALALKAHLYSLELANSAAFNSAYPDHMRFRFAE